MTDREKCAGTAAATRRSRTRRLPLQLAVRVIAPDRRRGRSAEYLKVHRDADPEPESEEPGLQGEKEEAGEEGGEQEGEEE